MEATVMVPMAPEEEQKPGIPEDAENTPLEDAVVDNTPVEMELAEEAVDKPKGGVVKITNISPGASVDQMKTLFGFLGTIVELALYPMDDNVPVASKICYVKYEDEASCDIAQHLTNTVFIDRPLVIVPLHEAEIPDEGMALEPKGPMLDFDDGMMQDPFASDPFAQFMGTFDVGNNLPPPPVLGNIDPVKIEEIRRTIFVDNLDDSVSPEMLVAFFSGVGEIKYVRLLQDGEGAKKTSLIEFTDLSAVATALQYTGVIFCGKPLNVHYSKCAIIKPDLEKLEAERKYADRMSRYSSRRRSSSLSKRSKSRSRSRDRRSRRSRTKSKSRSFSRSRRPRSISRSRKQRSRSKSFSRVTRRRSRSRSLRRRRSRSRTRSRSKGGKNKKISLPLPNSWDRRRRRSRSRSRSRDSKYRNSGSRRFSSNRAKRHSKSRSLSRSGSAEKKKSRSRSASKDRSKKIKEKSRSKSPSPGRVSSTSRRRSRKERRSRTRSRSRSRDRKTRDKERNRDPKRDRKERGRSSSKTKKEDTPKKDISPQFKDVDDIDNNSDMSIDEECLAASKKKSKNRSRASDDDSPRKSKKKSRSRREDSN